MVSVARNGSGLWRCLRAQPQSPNLEKGLSGENRMPNEHCKRRWFSFRILPNYDVFFRPFDLVNRISSLSGPRWRTEKRVRLFRSPKGIPDGPVTRRGGCAHYPAGLIRARHSRDIRCSPLLFSSPVKYQGIVLMAR